MLFNSYEFIFWFLPLTLLVFFILGGKDHRWAITWLVAGSLFFYGWWEWVYVGIILSSIVSNYFFGIFVDPKTISRIVSRRVVLVAGISFNLILIGYFKYTNFFAENLNRVFATDFDPGKIVLPLAISFFTFQQITYLVDMYRGEVEERGFLKYCLFVTFFPQLIAGPIVHHKEILPQFDKEKTWGFCPNHLAVGLTFFFIGLFKKVILADGISRYANSAFDKVAAGVIPNFIEAWSGALFYSFQLYFDFSGYADMAIGLACMFGIWLPLNFNSPYKAQNIIEFWRCWHMTLSRFMRDYLYVPLGGNQKGKFSQLVNLLLTMLLGGLWHGAAWTFVIWGGLHGLCLTINHLWQNFRRTLGHNLEQSTWPARWFARLVTFLVLCVLWVFFRAENMWVAMTFLKSMAGLEGSWSADSSGIQYNHYLIVVFLFIVWFAPNTQQLMSRYVPESYGVDQTSYFARLRLQWTPNVYWATFTSIVAVISLLNLTRVSEFLYFQF